MRTSLPLFVALLSMSAAATPQLQPTVQLGQTGSLQSQLGELYGSYFYVDPLTTATLELTNPTELPRTVTPTATLGGEHEVALDAVTIPARASVRVDLGSALAPYLQRQLGDSRYRVLSSLIQNLHDHVALLDLIGGAPSLPVDTGGSWGDGSRPASLWGSLQVTGDVAAISGWVLSTSVAESLQVNTVLQRRGSTQFHAMWWRPTDGTRVRFAVQNPLDTALRFRATVFTAGEQLASLPLELPAGESFLIDLEDLLVGARLAGGGPLPAVGSVLFGVDSASPGPGLVARAFLVDDERGFSVPLGIQEHYLNQGSRRQTPAVPLGEPPSSMGFPAGTVFAPQLLLGNVDPGASLTVTPVVYGATGVQGQPVPVWSGAPVVLAPLEFRVVDVLAEVCGGAPCPLQARGLVGLGVDFQGAPEQLLVEALTVNVDAPQPLRYSFYDPMLDPPQTATRYVAISFDLSGSKNTLLNVKNAGDHLAVFSFRLAYDSAAGWGTYKLTGLPLAPQELRVVDLRELRDLAVPDDRGLVLPPDVTFGNAVVKASPGVILGDPTYDPVAGTCISCPDPCDDDECIEDCLFEIDVIDTCPGSGGSGPSFTLAVVSYKLEVDNPVPNGCKFARCNPPPAAKCYNIAPCCVVRSPQGNPAQCPSGWWRIYKVFGTICSFDGDQSTSGGCSKDPSCNCQ